MKDFFANLIDRHQGRAEIVAPRAHSYFEEGLSPVNPETDYSSEALLQPQQGQPVVTCPTSSARLSGQQNNDALLTNTQIKASHDVPFAGSDTGAFRPDLQESNDLTPAENSNQNLTIPEPRAIRSSDWAETSPGSEFARYPVHNSEKPPLADPVATLDPNQRIDEVLRRLQDGLVSSDSRGLPENPDQSAGSAETNRVSNLNRGDLEAPAWLNQRQSELNLKNTEISPSPEPVVNVTIGRVEIKAMGESKTRPKPSRKKPTGVMSLDEYLNKRQRKGMV